MSKILVVLSGADRWTQVDGTTSPSGYWAEEFVEVYERLVDAGFVVDIATPGGVEPTADLKSLDPKIAGPEAPRYASYLDSISDALSSPLVLSDANMSDYVALVIPGGHGPVEDLYKDPDMARLLYEAMDTNTVIASVCHGPAALLSANDPSRAWPFADLRMTAFSVDEEVEFGTAPKSAWLLEDELRRLGARFEHGPNWKPYLVQDKNLITGQNPASSAMVGDALIATLKGK